MNTKEYNYKRVVTATHKVVDTNGQIVFVGSSADCVNKASVRTRWEKRKFSAKELKNEQ